MDGSAGKEGARAGMRSLTDIKKLNRHNPQGSAGIQKLYKSPNPSTDSSNPKDAGARFALMNEYSNPDFDTDA